IFGTGREHRTHAQIIRALLFRRNARPTRWADNAVVFSRPSLPPNIPAPLIPCPPMTPAAFLAKTNFPIVIITKRNRYFLINDYVDIALAMDADGVHVGQSDMEARAMSTLSLITKGTRYFLQSSLISFASSRKCSSSSFFSRS